MRHEPQRTSEPEKRINLKLTPETHRRLKIMAAARGTTLQGLISEWIEAGLREAEKPIVEVGYLLPEGAEE